MNIELTPKEFRRLLDLVYIGNWVLNSTRGDDRFQDYDDLESKIFALSPALSEPWNGTIVPSRAYTEGGIHEAIAYYEDNVFYEILAEELSRRDMDYPEINGENYDEIVAYREQAAKKSDFERTELAKEKTGVVLGGISAVNPVNGKEIPIWMLII